MTIPLPFPELRVPDELVGANMRHQPVPLPVPRRWKFGPGSACLPYECTLKGILEHCGSCCTGSASWPPSTGEGGCSRLGPTGCTLGVARPVKCHLYPLRVNAKGTLHVDSFTRHPKGLCKGNRGREGAPLLIDALRDSLVLIFGEAQVDACRAACLAGRDGYLDVPDWAVKELEQEAVWAVRNTPPPPQAHGAT